MSAFLTIIKIWQLKSPASSNKHFRRCRALRWVLICQPFSDMRLSWICIFYPFRLRHRMKFGDKSEKISHSWSKSHEFLTDADHALCDEGIVLSPEQCMRVSLSVYLIIAEFDMLDKRFVNVKTEKRVVNQCQFGSDLFVHNIIVSDYFLRRWWWTTMMIVSSMSPISSSSSKERRLLFLFLFFFVVGSKRQQVIIDGKWSSFHFLPYFFVTDKRKRDALIWRCQKKLNISLFLFFRLSSSVFVIKKQSDQNRIRRLWFLHTILTAAKKTFFREDTKFNTQSLNMNHLSLFLYPFSIETPNVPTDYC